jgi:hypothetical protein
MPVALAVVAAESAAVPAGAAALLGAALAAFVVSSLRGEDEQPTTPRAMMHAQMPGGFMRAARRNDRAAKNAGSR